MSDIFTLDELSAYVQADVSTTTGMLLRDLVTGLIDELVTDAPFDIYPMSVKAVALTAAARAYANPQGISSITIGSYSESRDGKSIGVYLTDGEKAIVVAAAGGMAGSSGIFSIDTVSTTFAHADICALNFGAIYCSCGAILTGSYPLYEV